MQLISSKWTVVYKRWLPWNGFGLRFLLVVKPAAAVLFGYVMWKWLAAPLVDEVWDCEDFLLAT